MKRELAVLIGLCAVLNLSAERFSAINEQGLLLWYSTLTDHTVMITGSESDLNADGDANNYAYITADTIIVPATVNHAGREYTVVQTNPYGVFNKVASLTTLYLPKTIELIGDTMIYSETLDDFDYGQLQLFVDVNYAFTECPNLKNIYVDEDNPYYTSVEGVLYTKDMKTLITYPQGRTATSYAPIEGCEHIGRQAFYYDRHLKEIDLPLSLKTIGNEGFQRVTNLEKLTIKDSVQVIGYNAFTINRRDTLQSLYIGTGLKTIRLHGLPKAAVIYCYATEPPSGAPDLNTKATLYVPRKSLNAYREADNWREFSAIYPIEPPIVMGVNFAEVSWVQNFSATGYVWSLYTDEAHTQLFMSLTFDVRGLLTEIVMGQNNRLSSRKIAENRVEEEERKFAEYYSFRISNLSANTAYYYSRQALAGSEVIDEESGTFQTLPSDQTVLSVAEADSRPSKILHNGQVYILHNGKQYTVTGTPTE